MKDDLSLTHSFEIGGIPHLLALLSLTLIGAIFLIWGRKTSRANRYPSLATRILAYSCLAGIVASLIVSLVDNPGDNWPEYLPLHFCDVMSVVCAWALLSRSLNAKSIAFFCVLCASAQALITPNLQLDYPCPSYYSFFFSHGMTVIAALYLPVSLKWRPRKYDFLVAQLFGISYLIFIHFINNMLDTNFGFTRFIPENGSVLSLLGPWPMYLIVMQIPAAIFMLTLNLILYKNTDRH